MTIMVDADPETALRYLHLIEEHYDVTVDEEALSLRPAKGLFLIADYSREKQKLTVSAETKVADRIVQLLS